MIPSLFFFFIGWAALGGLSSPLLELSHNKTVAIQSMSGLGKRTTGTRDKCAAKRLELEERGGLPFNNIPIRN